MQLGSTPGAGSAEAADRWLARRCEELEVAAAANPATAIAKAAIRMVVFIDGNLSKEESEARKSLRE